MAASRAFGAVASSSKSILGPKSRVGVSSLCLGSDELLSPISSPRMVKTWSMRSADGPAEEDDFSPMSSPRMAKTLSLPLRGRDALRHNAPTSSTARASFPAGSSGVQMSKMASWMSNTEEPVDGHSRFQEEFELPMGGRRSFKSFVELSKDITQAKNIAQAPHGEEVQAGTGPTRSSWLTQITEDLPVDNQPNPSRDSLEISVGSAPVAADFVCQAPSPGIIDASAWSPFHFHAEHVKSFPVLLGRLGTGEPVHIETSAGSSRTLLEHLGRFMVGTARRHGQGQQMEEAPQTCCATFLASQARDVALAMRLRRQSRDVAFVV